MVKVQQRGLGKGLSALISENYTHVPPSTDDSGSTATQAPGIIPSEMAIDQLVPGKYQPRSRFDESQLQELSDSIAKNGIMQPIIARPVKRGGKDTYEIVAGERRWRAANLAGLKSVPVIIREIEDPQALELAIIENVQRADLTPLEEASGYQRLLEEFGHTQSELSKIVGKSRSHITNLLRLLSLPDSIKPLVEEGKLTMGHARALLTANNPEEIAEQIISKGLSVRQAEALSRSSQGLEKKTRGKDDKKSSTVTQAVAGDLNKDPDILVLEETLSESLGMSVAINDRGQNGEIVISYESLTQLDELLQKLGSAA